MQTRADFSRWADLFEAVMFSDVTQQAGASRPAAPASDLGRLR